VAASARPVRLGRICRAGEAMKSKPDSRAGRELTSKTWRALLTASQLAQRLNVPPLVVRRWVGLGAPTVLRRGEHLYDFIAILTWHCNQLRARWREFPPASPREWARMHRDLHFSITTMQGAWKSAPCDICKVMTPWLDLWKSFCCPTCRAQMRKGVRSTAGMRRPTQRAPRSSLRRRTLACGSEQR
jgi:hypothetical protein